MHVKVFFDPNRLEADGTASLGVYAFSESGHYFAYGITKFVKFAYSYNMSINLVVFVSHSFFQERVRLADDLC